jgi:hypothetical protein
MLYPWWRTERSREYYGRGQVADAMIEAQHSIKINFLKLFDAAKGYPV